MKLALAAMCVCVLALAAVAPNRSASSQPASQNGAGPNLADLMSATQLRHIKLSFAGHLQNWELAGYEVAQMRKTFAAAAKHFPEVQGVQLAKLVSDISEPALKEIEQAIKARDSAAFTRSFQTLTEACNSCHRDTKVGFIVIRVPTSSPFSNQSIAPQN